MKILGIESSADETAAAIVEGSSESLKLLSSVVASSMDLHKAYGGMVPEIAARSHIESIIPVIEEALDEAKTDWDEIDAIAVTYGPGLGGSLLIGVLTARTLAIVKKKPLYGINHVEAHVYAAFLGEKMPEFPLLALIVSGGHTQLVYFEDHFKYQVLGRTTDDAVGEAYDKVAKMLGLPYPGGPSVEKLAKEGNPHAYKLPKAKTPGKYDFSYSGLKTAVLRTAQEVIGEDFNFPSHQLSERLTDQQKQDIAASFNQKAVEVLVDKTLTSYEEFAPKSVVVAGGVSASPELRKQLSARLPIEPIFPDIQLCTDNAAMIAALGYFKAKANHPKSDPYALEINPSLQM